MKLIDTAVAIVRQLQQSGYTAYFAGGWVRDHLLGHASEDIDIATNASPDDVQTIFKHTIPVGESFGVVIVLEKGHTFEVASFRKDGLYVDGRKPSTIEMSTPEEDAQRRDFTINGMFYDPITGEIHDFVGGRADLDRKVIRAIGTAKHRFSEDRLRMIRGVRMAARFHFDLDRETEEAIALYAPSLFPAVSIERVWQEFVKITAHEGCTQAFGDLFRLGLLQEIFPQLKALSTQQLNERITPFHYYPKTCPTILYIYALFPEASREELHTLCRALKTSGKELKWIDAAFKTKMLISQEKEGAVEPVDWTHYYSEDTSDMALQAYAAHLSEKERHTFLETHLHRQQTLDIHITKKKNKTPVVSAQTLIGMGIPPGITLGNLLREAERIAVNDDLHASETVLLKLKETPLWEDAHD